MRTARAVFTLIAMAAALLAAIYGVLWLAAYHPETAVALVAVLAVCASALWLAGALGNEVRW